MIKVKTWEWFRLHNADWDAPEVATLDLAAQGFLLRLLQRMLDQMSPIKMDVVRMVARQHSINKRTVDRLVETFSERGLIFDTGEGFWSSSVAREFVFRGEKAENFSQRNRKVSRKRWEKDEENQGNAMPKKERDNKGEPPSGASPNPYTENDISVAVRDTKECDPEHAPSFAPEGASGASSDHIEIEPCEPNIDEPMPEDRWQDFADIPYPDDEPEEQFQAPDDSDGSQDGDVASPGLHLHGGEDIAAKLANADDLDVIILHGGARTQFPAYLNRHLSNAVKDRFRELYRERKLTAGAVTDAIGMEARAHAK